MSARVKLPLWGVCGQVWYLRERGCVMLGQDTAIVGANLAATRWVAVVFQGGKKGAYRRLWKIQFELKLFLEGLAPRRK